MRRSKKVSQKDHTGPLVSSFLYSLADGGSPFIRQIFRYYMRHGKTPDCTMQPELYSDATSFAWDYQAVRFLKKAPFLTGSTPDLRRSAALKSFRNSEERCKETNLRFAALNRGIQPEAEILSKLEKARWFIERVLGAFSWDMVVKNGDFGPGASVGIKRRDKHVVKKIGHPRPTVTGTCNTLLECLRQWSPLWDEVIRPPRLVTGSVVTTVPKDSKTDRCICIEPLWNMFFQKGIGSVIRQRLRRAGWCLNTGGEVNKSLAREASITGKLATVDLSAASDSISLGLCEYLLPKPWLEALKITRSEFVEIDGERLLLRKMSSMGNGFTFELESLIFLSLAWACSPRGHRLVGKNVTSFGDDILLPTEAYAALVKLLDYCGFSVNKEKSFHTGFFRESCGGHFFKGYDVTPFHLDKRVTTAQDLIWFANSTRAFAERIGIHYCDRRLKPVYDLAVGRLGALRRLRVPRDIGHVGLWSSFDEALPKQARTHQQYLSWEGWLVEGLVDRSKTYLHSGTEALVAVLLQGPGVGGDAITRSETTSRRLGVAKILVSHQWCEISPWGVPH